MEIEKNKKDDFSGNDDLTELVSRIESLFRTKNTGRCKQDLEGLMNSIALMIESKDAYTTGHIRRVADLAISIGKLFGMTENELEALWIGGMLHDIGKITIPPEVLNKPDALDDDEKRIMMKHVHSGYQICHQLKKNLNEVLEIVRHHHEHLDGSGYPDRLSGDDISLPVRIMAAVDIYDALTSDRPYRKAVGRDEAMAVLDSMSGKCWLDPVVVGALRTALGKGENS